MQNPEVIVVPSFFFMIGYICWLWAGTAQRRQRLKLISEVNNKLLDRLGSVQDFSALLQTEAGAKFMQNMASDPPIQGPGPQRRILMAAQTGAVLVCLGLGLFAVGVFQRLEPDASQAFTTLGVIAMSLGVGFVVSSVTAYRLSSRLGLLPRTSESGSIEAPSVVS